MTMKTPEEIADALQQSAPLTATERQMMVAAIEADRAQREADGSIHAATVAALKDRLDWYEDDPEAYNRLQAVIEWIEDEPDAFWDRFAGPMLDDLEAHA